MRHGHSLYQMFNGERKGSVSTHISVLLGWRCKQADKQHTEHVLSALLLKLFLGRSLQLLQPPQSLGLVQQQVRHRILALLGVHQRRLDLLQLVPAPTV